MFIINKINKSEKMKICLFSNNNKFNNKEDNHLCNQDQKMNILNYNFKIIQQ